MNTHTIAKRGCPSYQGVRGFNGHIRQRNLSKAEYRRLSNVNFRPQSGIQSLNVREIAANSQIPLGTDLHGTSLREEVGIRDKITQLGASLYHAPFINDQLVVIDVYKSGVPT
jgi:hypothetical protein